MFNFSERVLQHPQFYRQPTCGSPRLTAINRPMEARFTHPRFTGSWTQYNYFSHVTDGAQTT